MRILGVLLGVLLAIPLFWSTSAWAQAGPPFPDDSAGANQAPPRSDQDANESSSRDTRIDLSPPKDDSKAHPDSEIPKADSEPSETREMRPYNPLRAIRDDDVGEYYFKLKNYKAALARYQDALEWKDRDAIATFGLAKSYEKLNQPEEAVRYYQEYLKILPHGALSKDAEKALKKLQEPGAKATEKTPAKP